MSYDPGAPWRGFDPSTFEVDVPEFDWPSRRPASLATCFAILPQAQAAEISAVAQLAEGGAYASAERVRQAVGYAGFGGDRHLENRDTRE